jgi:hypothetical protein
LFDALVQSFHQESKQIVFADGESVLTKPLIDDTDSLSPSTREEADSRMMLHVAHAAHRGHQKIKIQIVDTDVVVLAVYVSDTPGCHNIIFMTG